MTMQPTVAESFAALLRADPAAPVAWTAAGVRTRRDLDALADAAAVALGQVPAGSRVAVQARCGFTFLAAVLAVWRRAGCAVLFDAGDPRAPRLDLARRCGAAAVLDGDADWRVTPLDGGAPAGRWAAIKLTSGTTAEPRAVAVDAAALAADAAAVEAAMGIGDGDRVLAAVPMSFSYGVGNLLVPALQRGRVLVLPDARHPLGLLRALRAGAPTVLPAVPALVRALLQQAGPLPASLRLCVSAGAPLAPAVAAAFRARFGQPVHVFYGATEAGGICYDRTGTAAERGSVGAPIAGVDVWLDADGRACVRSAAVGVALEADADLEGGTFRTADLGEFRDGELVLLGRASDSFDVGGHKVHPHEVERAIAALPGVRDVAVVPWHDDAGRRSAAALVVGRGIDERAVRSQCARELPAAKVPRCIVLVDELPRSDRGKLTRDAVERLLAAAPRRGEAGRSA
ncbi:MAG: long-chain fatty acid--CoA ligase [Planctomycetes bacterium]|nr:long-chain fatty acid--CoA ligase [Planctomycetota bacterium]